MKYVAQEGYVYDWKDLTKHTYKDEETGEINFWTQKFYEKKILKLPKKTKKKFSDIYQGQHR